jgi:hypothetical protein
LELGNTFTQRAHFLLEVKGNIDPTKNWRGVLIDNKTLMRRKQSHIQKKKAALNIFDNKPQRYWD